MPIYMKFGPILGGATAKGHEKWIELQSAHFGGSGDTATGRSSNAPPVRELVVTKLQDCSSTDLFRASLFGAGVPVKIDFVRTESAVQPYLGITLENAMISSYSMSGQGSSDAVPMESLALNFTKIEYGYHPASSPNQGAPPAHQAPRKP